jgi:hypothetical protein
MIGPGKYDNLATYCREQAQAEGVIVIVVRGNKGQGFSIQTVDPRLNLMLPAMLRILADSIQRDLNDEKTKHPLL